MQNPLLQTIEALAKEKGIEAETIVTAIEDAVLTASRKYYKTDEDLKTRFNAETGQVDLFAINTLTRGVFNVWLQMGNAGGAAQIEFVPHLLGMTRGILSTMHATLTRPVPAEALLERYREFYAEHPFVRILPAPPTLKGTVGSNYCDISIATSADDRRVVVMSSIDNLLKGQSGIAMQNLNLMFGLDQRLGLDRPPLYP